MPLAESFLFAEHAAVLKEFHKCSGRSSAGLFPWPSPALADNKHPREELGVVVRACNLTIGSSRPAPATA